MVFGICFGADDVIASERLFHLEEARIAANHAGESDWIRSWIHCGVMKDLCKVGLVSMKNML